APAGWRRGPSAGSARQRPDAAQRLVLAECLCDRVQVGTAGGAGEGDPDELGGLPDRAGVGVRVLLVLLGVRCEAVLGGQVADLAEPLWLVPGVPVALGEVLGERRADRGVDTERGDPLVLRA